MVKRHFKSYKYAKDGFLQILSLKHNNFIIELILTALVLILAQILRISETEWMFVIFCCGFVLTTEILNTAIEEACNAIDSNQNAQIKIAKDIAASAVVMSCITAFIIGLLIFLPKIIILISHV